MRTCKTCGVMKPLTEFRVNAPSRDGRTLSCKVCLNARDLARLAISATARKKKRQWQIKYLATKDGKRAMVRASTKYRLNNRRKKLAHKALKRAIDRGSVVPWPVCAVPECASRSVQGHHPDYSSPFDVVWLCDRHHKMAHRQ